MTPNHQDLRRIAEAANPHPRPEPCTPEYAAWRDGYEGFAANISPAQVIALLDEIEGLEKEAARWVLRVSDIREASGVGAKPMLADLPQAIAAKFQGAESVARSATERAERLEKENADLKSSVIAFAAPWAVSFGEGHGLPKGHLHPAHYDLLARCGARMVDFTRADDSLLSSEQAKTDGSL